MLDAHHAVRTRRAADSIEQSDSSLEASPSMATGDLAVVIAAALFAQRLGEGGMGSAGRNYGQRIDLEEMWGERHVTTMHLEDVAQLTLTQVRSQL